MRSIGGPAGVLDPAEVEAFVAASLAAIDLDGRSLCVVAPDATRQCPLDLLLPAVERAVTDRVRSCEVVIALGTHAPMTDGAIRAMVGSTTLPVRNHAWDDPATFAHVGTLSAETIQRRSEGRLVDTGPVDIRVNRAVVDAEVTLIVGPVLPHEVVGFSGGHKYLFPGLSGPELIDLTHWLGALITSREIIGRRGITPVRALIEAAADLVPGERHALCVVVDGPSGGLEAATFGDPVDAWDAAAAVAEQTHVVHLDRPVHRVLSIVSPRYDDLWTAAKGFYKVEPVVADGGEVVVYAPHVTEVARMHPGLVDLGYHGRDFFLAGWDRYRHHPWGELAHSTHLYGAATFDGATGVEHPRVTVTLATGIPADVVDRINLTHRDPTEVDLAAWAADPDALVVPDAGEVLYRLP